MPLSPNTDALFLAPGLMALCDQLTDHTPSEAYSPWRSSFLGNAIGRRLGLSARAAQNLGQVVALRDVGKLGIPRTLLHKNGRLSERERGVIGNHVWIGFGILSADDSPLSRMAADVAANHHERLDGTGYPLARKGDEISLESRVTAVVDVFEAMISRRPYREPLPLAQALDILRQHGGKSLDRDCVESLLAEEKALIALLSPEKNDPDDEDRQAIRAFLARGALGVGKGAAESVADQLLGETRLHLESQARQMAADTPLPLGVDFVVSAVRARRQELVLEEIQRTVHEAAMTLKDLPRDATTQLAWLEFTFLPYALKALRTEQPVALVDAVVVVSALRAYESFAPVAGKLDSLLAELRSDGSFSVMH